MSSAVSSVVSMQAGTRLKCGARRSSSACEAVIDTTIKKCNHGTRKNDKFLKCDPALNAVINLELTHSHALIQLDHSNC